MSLPPVSVGRTDFPLRLSTPGGGPLPLPSLAAGPLFRLLDGPPYANGAPHLGHVLNKHLKDAVARAAHQAGAQVDWRPGWDCHGLPLELAVEREGHDPTRRLEFLDAARAYATRQVEVQAGVFRQQGWCADWAQPWHTHDPAMEAGTLRLFADLVDAGRIRVRLTAVPWCTQCQSTVAGAEQEEGSVTAPAWLVPFALSEGEAVLSWTTTPWTLPHHQGLVVHPEAVYEALEGPSGVAWVSQATVQRWSQTLGVTRSHRQCLGRELMGRAYRSPWHEGRVVGDARVTPEAGTGVLHAVAGLAELDTELAHDHGWALQPVLAPSGAVQSSPCQEQVGQLAGVHATAPVRAVYQGQPWFHEMAHTMLMPHCWRHKVPLLVRASRQVFVTLDDEVRARAVGMVEQLDFTPEAGRQRLTAAMAHRPDWCVSRQRTWGVPLALFLDKSTQQPHACASTWMRRVADAVASQGVSAWWSHPSHTWLKGEVDEAQVERVDDVLDVWFDSACAPQLQGVGDVVVEGHDQHRGWFQSCLWLAAALDRGLPFRRVVTHGFVLDRTGRKLSKSTGGDAQDQADKVPVWSSLPSDVVRLWALAGSEGHDKPWSLPTVQAAQHLYARLRGVVRFLVSNQLPTATPVDASTLPAWDRYWWDGSVQLARHVRTHLLQGNTGEALHHVARWAEAFSSHALGSWKDRLYCAPATTVERQALDAVVRGCLNAWGQVLALLTPRLADEVRPFGSGWDDPSESPALTVDERDQALLVLRWKEVLAPVVEELAREKVAPGARTVAGLQGLVAWPGQLLADALDVGHLSPHDTPLVRAVDQQVDLGRLVTVGRSPHAICPRCRRAQEHWLGDMCQPCHVRTGHGEGNQADKPGGRAA